MHLTLTLFYGDNLVVLKKHFPSECVDLLYLDPPFNSKTDYNILFKEVTGEQSTAQIQAFSDFWHWDIEAAQGNIDKDHALFEIIEPGFINFHVTSKSGIVTWAPPKMT